jgi:peptide-methionine (S)-S-oxide reductase
MFARKSLALPTEEQALPGRSAPLPSADRHALLERSLEGPFPAGLAKATFGMGCFWGAERVFWTQPGGYTTAVGYAGGFTENATYEEVCTGLTGHTEVVLVVYDPARLAYESLLATFWQSHDPTQGMRQGADVGTQYRSAIYCYSGEQLDRAEHSRERYKALLSRRGHLARITTEIAAAPPFYYAEVYHQQYLAKNPGGYCGLGGCGVAYAPAGAQR